MALRPENLAAPSWGAILADTCFSCPGTDGHSAGAIPSIAGQSAPAATLASPLWRNRRPAAKLPQAEDRHASRPWDKTMQRHSFKSGEIIFHEDDPSDAAFLIIEGQVEILHQRKSGDKTTVAILERGEYFGEMGVIDDKPRSATAKAKTDVACMSVGKEEFMDMLLHRPQESIELLKVLFERLRRANEKLALIEKAQG